MKKYLIQSTMVHAVIDATEEGQGMIIEFTGGSTYKCPDANKELVSQFLASDSKGKYFNEIISPNYKLEVVHPKWRYVGIASETIQEGSRIECCAETGECRVLKLKSLS